MLAVPSAALIGVCFRHETLPVQVRRKLKQAAAKTAPSAHPHSKFAAVRQALIRSALRPLYFLCAEPITLALSAWIAFAWGTLYLFLEAVPLVFEPYGFNHAHKTRGVSFVGIALGSLLGFAVHLYALHTRRRITAPEQRLPEACVGAVLFMLGFFVFAWTARSDGIPWIAPQVGTAIIMMGLFMVYVSFPVRLYKSCKVCLLYSPLTILRSPDLHL